MAVVGESPQVVTETLHALASASPPQVVTRIHLAGTSVSKSAVRARLLGGGGQIARLCAALRLPRPQVQFHLLRDRAGRALDDVRTTADNDDAARQVFALVRRLTASAAPLHGSVAGGRKTLGLYLALAFALYGRAQDRLYHVLVPKEAERDRSFFFPAPGSRTRVDLAEIPFPRLREFLPERGGAEVSIARLVEAVQGRIEGGRLPALRIEVGRARGRVRVGPIEVQTRTPDALLWARFAERRKGCESGGRVGCPCCFLTAEEVPPEWGPVGMERDDPKEKAHDLQVVCARIKESLRAAGVPPLWIDEVSVRGVGRRGERRYGVALAPGRIAVERYAGFTAPALPGTLAASRAT